MKRMVVAYVVEILAVKQMCEFTVTLNLRKGCCVLINRKDKLLSPASFFLPTKQIEERIYEHTA